MEILDVTLPISDRLPVWPGDPPIELLPVSSIAAGDEFNVTALRLGTHTGTHVDAPRHLYPDAPTVDWIPLGVLLGDAWVSHLPSVERSIAASDLDAAGIPDGTRRLLLKTRNGDHWDRSPWSFSPDYVALSENGAEWIADRGVQLVGVDYLSVDPADASEPAAHRVLLSRGIVVVEGLDLRAIQSGSYQLACLPLKVVGADGAPARVVLMR